MSGIGVAAWCAAVIGLGVAAARALHGARRAPGEPVGRGRVLAWAGAIAVVAAAAIWVWAGALAQRGGARLARSSDASARVELVALVAPVGGALTIGGDAASDVEVPSSWGVGALVRVERAGDGVRVTAIGAEAVIGAGCDARDRAGDGAVVDVTVCRGARAVAAMRIARAGDGVRIEPRVRRGGRLAPHATELAAGAALQLGAASGAVPGLDAWELPAPRGHADVLVAPGEVGGGCAAWADANGGDAFADGAHRCRVRLAPAYELAVVVRAPDVAGVTARAAWGVVAIAGGPLLALLALAMLRRGAVDRARLAHLAALGWVAVVVAAIGAWRIAWAHRIDLLRDLAPFGARTALAELLAVAAGGALAAIAAALVARRRVAALAGVAWAALAVLALAELPLPRGAAGIVLAAAALAALALAPRRALPATPPALLAALAVAAAGAATFAPRLVAAKLVLAWAIPIVGYEALRGAGSLRGAALALAALATALAALFRLDAGVTIAIAAPGVVAATIALTHDLLYHPRDARLLDRWELRQQPLTLGHAAVLGAVGLALVVGALAAGAALPARATHAALHLPAVIALALLAAALVAAKRRAGAAALIPAMIAVVAAAIWLERGALLDRAIASPDASGRRVAAVVAPGYALLRDDDRAVAALTAWRETRTADAAHGDGWFAARIADPGVAVSIENDYLAVLVVRETGVVGVAATTALLLLALGGAWTLGAASRPPGARGTRRRTIAAVTLGAVTIYQPLAALGVLPLTGVSWPGLGLDSPSDALVHLALLGWLALPGAGRADPYEIAVRTARRWRRATAVATAAAALAAIGGIAVVARGAAFAATRGDDRPVAAGVARATAYARSLACAAPVAPTTRALGAPRGAPTDAATARYDRELVARWALARAGLDAAAHEVAATGTCRDRGAWDARLAGARCALTLDAGWPEIRVDVPRAGPVACAVAADPDVLAPLAPRTRAKAPRVRVVGAATGAARADHAELVADHLVVRLRPGAPDADLSTEALASGAPDASGAGPAPARAADAGIVATARATLAPGVVVIATDRGAAIEADAGAARLLVARPGPAGPRWRRIAAASGARLATDLAGTAVLVVDEGARRRAWLVRAGPGVAPLLADDRGDARHYVYAGSLPALGWVNPYDVRRSLGLDGWIHAALADRRAAAPSLDDAPACGTLAPPRPPSPCAPSPADGVLECEVAIDPHLELPLRALTELAALDPAALTTPAAPATRAAFVVLRGDTGELLASGDFVPGRAGPVHAPGTPAIARALVALRDEPGEASAEKADLHRPIAAGSLLKPFVARAAELVAPQQTRGLAVYLDPSTTGRCRRGVHDLLGHCPPRELLEREGGWVDFHAYLARSSNAFQALLGLVAPGWPGGTFTAAGLTIDPDDVLDYAPSGWTEPLIVDRVIGARGVRLDPLRATPFWQRLERLLGRPLCTLGGKAACVRAADRRDLCAARALPVSSPGADLRHLVALGPSTFDLYAAGGGAATPVGEYFQLLRGSAVHPIGSLAQLADAFNRLVYEPAPAGGLHQLAASWFPAPVVGAAPAERCTAGGGRAGAVLGDAGGLCGVLRAGGTAARAFADLLGRDDVVLYGAKTGTIDTLGDVAERRRACEAWNRAHTIPGAARQPYHLTCGAAPPDDSLFLVSFAVKVDGALVPLTLGVQLERTGKGVAPHVARAHLDAIVAHLRGATP